MIGRLLTASALAVLLNGAVEAADHREAPLVNLRPAADLNDLYVFRSSDNPANAVLIMTVNPISDPDFAGSYAFDPTVLYRFGIDTSGDAFEDKRVDILFDPLQGRVQNFKVRLNNRVVLNGVTTPPQPFSDFTPTIIREGAISAFAGPTDDPFFFDGVGFQAFVGGIGSFRGEDGFAGFNVSSIAIELPFALISDGRPGVQVSAFTFNPRPPQDRRFGARRIVAADRKFQQFERTGNPGVATAFIPSDLRDQFNQSQPKQDADRFGGVIVETLTRLGTSPENIATLASIAVPDTMKFELAAPAGFPNGRNLDDDVIDTVLSLVLNGPVSDGVDANDREFLTSFPYLAPPHQPTPPSSLP